MDMEQAPQEQPQLQSAPAPMPTKFCQHCGGQLPADAVICTLCGRQVGQIEQAAPQVVINNTNTNTNTNTNINAAGSPARARSKWVALLLCIFLGAIGAHKFYEGKAVVGVIYLFTLGLFGIGVFIDFLCLLFKPNPYYI